MKALSRGTGIAISLVSGFLVLALLAELYYLLCLKKKKSTSTSSSKRRRRRRILHHQQEREEEEKEEEEEEIGSSPTKELLYLFCWKKPSSLSSSEMYCSSSSSRSRVDNNVSERSEDLQLGIDAELMRLHSLSGPPRFLFTIKEETKEDLLEYSEDGRRSRKNSISRGGRSLSDLLATTTETPMSSPPFFNPLFESFKNDNERSRLRSSSSSTSLSSPPPKFKFLRDAEEKLYRKILTEEALRVHRSSGGGSPAASPPPPMTMTTRGPEDHEDGPFITIIISKTQQQQQQHPTPSQVNPLPSSPPSITSTSTRTAAEQGKHVTYFGTNV